MSRNFRLQKIGNIDWLFENYKFDEISKNIDELIIINLEKVHVDKKKFINTVKKIIDNCFIPIILGGNINSINDAEFYLKNGADKILINSLFYHKPNICKNISLQFGAQSVVAGVDYIIEKKNSYILVDKGKKKIKVNLSNYIKKLINYGCGEIIFQSVVQDGCGYGLDLSVLKYIKNHNVPHILMGGVGNSKHILSGIKNKNIDGICTANLLNFMGNTFQETRTVLKKHNVDIINWDNSYFNKLKNKFKNYEK